MVLPDHSFPFPLLFLSLFSLCTQKGDSCMEKILARLLCKNEKILLFFLLLIMTFTYASATLQSKKGTVKEIRIFSAAADAFPSTSLHWKWMILKIQESQKCLKYKVVVLSLIIY